MLKPQLVILVFMLTILMSFSNSNSQVIVSEDSSGSVIDQSGNDLEPGKKICKLYHSKKTEIKNVMVIEFDLDEEADVKLEVCNSKGQIIEILIDEVMDPGNYKIHFKTTDEIIPEEHTYKLEVKGISGLRNVLNEK